ncbi:MAG: CPBP family intramembrane metalloprotease [Treponema sp.]|nr:CPBP family intramembrane metalloprotease [Treponema sp.]
MMLFLSWSALCFGFLMIIQALMQALTLILPVDYKETLIDLNFSKFEYAVVFLNLLTGAFYEEVIYREYLPETLLLFSKERKIPAILSECACVLVFAMSHRYLGLMAVLNALLGGIMLRICRKKSLSIWAGTFAHFAYNAVLLIFAILQKK